MKKVLLTILFCSVLLLLTCRCSNKSEDPSPDNKPKTDQAIQPFYDDFLSRAKAFNVPIDKTVVLQFGTCDCEENGVWKVSSSASDINLDFYVLHTLGHALLGRPETTEASIMNKMHVSVWKTKEQAYINELFKK